MAGTVILREVIIGYWNRFKVVISSGKYDLIWIEKECFPYVPSRIELLLLPSYVPYILDFDDATFHTYDRHRLSLVRKTLTDKIGDLMTSSRLVFAGNSYLANKVMESKAVVDIIPTVVDLNKYISGERKKTAITIGWIGSPVTSQFLFLIKNSIKKILLSDNNIKFIAIGANENVESIGVEVIPWTEKTEVDQVSEIDIGVMPLTDGYFERGKCGYKLIQYMALKKPIIASPIGVNKEIVESGVNGFLAATEEEWDDAFNILVNDYKLRSEMGERGYQSVKQKYSLDVTAPKVLRAITRISQGCERSKSIMPNDNKELTMLPEVCVFIPFYNNEPTLRYAVLSIIKQSYNNTTLVLIDDGSTDNSCATIMDLVDDDKVKLIRDSTNRGLVFRLNQMVELTNAPYIARMDADDISHFDRINQQMKIFLNTTDVDIVSSGIAVVDDSYVVKGVRDIYNGQPGVLDFIKYGGIVHATSIFKRDVLAENCYKEEFYRAEDRELFLRLYSKVKIYRVNKPLYYCMEYGTLKLENMLSGYQSERNAIKKHGVDLIGLRQVCFYYCRSLFKSTFVFFAAKFGCLQLLSKKSSGRYDGDYFSLQKALDMFL